MRVYQSRVSSRQDNLDSTSTDSSKATLLSRKIPPTHQGMRVLHWPLRIRQPSCLGRRLESKALSARSLADKSRWNQSTSKGCRRRRSKTLRDRSRRPTSQAAAISGIVTSQRRDRPDYDLTIEYRQRSMQSRKGAFYVAKELMEKRRNLHSLKKHKELRVEPHFIRQLCMRNQVKLTFQCYFNHLIYRKQYKEPLAD